MNVFFALKGSKLFIIIINNKANASDTEAAFLYSRHLCRRVYSFRLSVRPFVRSYVRMFVRSFVIPSRSWNLRPSFALKFLKWCISH